MLNSERHTEAVTSPACALGFSYSISFVTKHYDGELTLITMHGNQLVYQLMLVKLIAIDYLHYHLISYHGVDVQNECIGYVI